MPGYEGRDGIFAVAATLQIPVHEGTSSGGLKFVLKSKAAGWLAALYKGERRDFYVSLQQVKAGGLSPAAHSEYGVSPFVVCLRSSKHTGMASMLKATILPGLLRRMRI